jgi:hypothetical protein
MREHTASMPPCDHDDCPPTACSRSRAAAGSRDWTVEEKLDTMKLHRYDFEIRDGKMVQVKKDELYVWAPVHTASGLVELEGVQEYDDELKDLVAGWEWRKFILIPQNDELSCEAEQPKKGTNTNEG